MNIVRLTDGEWDTIKGLVPGANVVNPRYIDSRQFVEAVLSLLHQGSSWDDWPQQYGDSHRAYLRFERWDKRAVWQRITETLAGAQDTNSQSLQNLRQNSRSLVATLSSPLLKILDDNQWSKVVKVIPPSFLVDQQGVSPRMFVDAILYLAKTNSPWKSMPEEFGGFRSAYSRFVRWDEVGIWQSIAEALKDERELKAAFTTSVPSRTDEPYDETNTEGIVTDLQWAVIDNQAIETRYKGIKPRRYSNNRNFVESVLYVTNTGISWWNLPRSFGAPLSIIDRFISWHEKYDFWNRLSKLIHQEPELGDLLKEGARMPHERVVLPRAPTTPLD
jgi:transposase